MVHVKSTGTDSHEKLALSENMCSQAAETETERDLLLDMMMLGDFEKAEEPKFSINICYGRGRGLSDITVPRIPACFQLAGAKGSFHCDKTSPPVEGDCLVAGTLLQSGKGRARLLQCQADASVKHLEEMRSKPGSQACSDVGQRVQLNVEHCNNKFDIKSEVEFPSVSQTTNQGKRRKKLTFRSFNSFLTEKNALEKPRHYGLGFSRPKEAEKKNLKEFTDVTCFTNCSLDVPDAYKTNVDSWLSSDNHWNSGFDNVSSADDNDVGQCMITDGDSSLQKNENKYENRDGLCFTSSGSTENDKISALEIDHSSSSPSPDTLIQGISSISAIDVDSLSSESFFTSTVKNIAKAEVTDEDSGVRSSCSSGFVKKKSGWKLVGPGVVHIQNIPEKSEKDLEELISKYGTILEVEKHFMGDCAMRFKLSSNEACECVALNLHENDTIFPGTVLKCYDQIGIQKFLDSGNI